MLRLAALLFLASGCVHTRPATLSAPEGRADLNARTAGRVATLHVRGEPSQSVRNLHIGPDETTWVNRLNGQPQSAPTADVTSVSMRRGTVWRPLLIGTGVGAALGALASGGEQSGWISFSPAFWIGLGAIDGALIGAGFGAAQTDRFRAEPQRTDAQISSAEGL